MPAENREDEAGNIGSADKIPGKETLHTAIDGFRSGLAFEEKAFLSADRLTVWRTNSAVMMLARQSIRALCQERCCFKMSENPLEFGMVCVVVKLALCYVFQRVLFFCRVRSANIYPTVTIIALR